MKIDKKDIGKSQLELTVEVSSEELQPFISKGVEELSKQVKIEGFRPGKVPYEILKQKIGEMSILEEAARLFITKKIPLILEENVKEGEIIGRPEVDVSKLAPGNPVEYKIKLNLLPEINLGAYKDFSFVPEKIEIKPEEVDKTLTDLAEMRVQEKISEEPIADGDKVIAVVNLFLDKVPVEDGQNPELSIIIGKKYFVEGFDKNIINLKKGDRKEFALNYPSNHWQKNLAGKKVEFKVEIKEVYKREIPEINDALAQIFRFKSLEDLKNNLEKTIEEQKKREADQKLEAKIVDKIIAESRFGDIPEVLIKNESTLMRNEMEQHLLSQGANFQDYLKSINKSSEELTLEMLPDAVKRVKGALVFRKIAELENIEISPKELEKEIKKIKDQYGHDQKIMKNVDNPSYQAYITHHLLNQKVAKNLKLWNLKS